MSWIKDIINPKRREWEEFYRNRHQHDKIVRSTHGVNCTGGCSWQVHVKEGLVTWETQQLDYPKLEKSLPPYEPRGCQRGISASWYVYSPTRVKYPYIRGTLLDLWRAAKRKNSDPVEAWESIQSDSDARASYQQARGKGGFRRSTWDEMLELIAASNIYTIKKYGPDRVVGFSPIPAMSQLSYGAGSRYLQLLGGVNLSFYDWYCDLPPASPEIWGEQTDVQESADWFNSKFIVSMGANLGMTRTPDVHFISEARTNGSKFTVFSPDFSMVSKFADQWVPINAGQDGAFWQAVTHVILKEFYVDKDVDYFTKYSNQYTDAPILVEVMDKSKPGKFLRANRINKYANEENGDWKFLMFDEETKAPKMPKGSVGHRWAKKQGQWNLELKDGIDESEIKPQLSFINDNDEILQLEFEDFSNDNKISKRGVPVKYIESKDGKVAVTTAFDLLMAQHGVGRGLDGDYPSSYEDDSFAFTPAWQEKFTGIGKDTLINFAREFATTAEKTEGKCTVIIGAGINHWYHNNLMYRSAITSLMLCGCIGKNGGGLAHYVGQEKLAPQASWKTIAMAGDWQGPPRVQNAPTWHYMHSDQWRYEGPFAKYSQLKGDNKFTEGHTADANAKAVRMGWLPFYPQFEKSSIEIVKEAKDNGAKNEEEIIAYVVEQLKSKKLKFAAEDPDNEKNWPRMWFIWRGNAMNASAKGQEYFFRHYLGTHDNSVAEEEVSKDMLKEVQWRDSVKGKMDLVVDLNFRMDTTALYSDIVLPTAHWYEKNDLNTTDMHSFVHPLSEAVPPSWESRTDWQIFKAFGKTLSVMAEDHFDGPIEDLVCSPLNHDTPAEIAQTEVKDWAKGECEPIPGKTMPGMKIVTRDYKKLFNKFISFGPNPKTKGIGAHGVSWKIGPIHDKMLKEMPTVKWEGEEYVSLEDAKKAANVVLRLAPETNGESAMLAFESHEKRVGLPLKDMAEGTAEVTMNFDDIQRQPRRQLTSPVWSGIINNGRQSYYLEHEGYIAFGEHLPTYKPKIDAVLYGDIKKDQMSDKTLMLNYLTPHGKWHIHSTYYDNLRMLTLSRGKEPIWMNDKDAEKIGIVDNDWVEAYNDHGVVVTNAAVSSRIPPGICIMYHAPERTIGVPKSPLRKNRRAGSHNSLTRVKLKPNLMMGGYGQFTFGFNYWGPTGVNRDTHILIRKLEGKPQY